MPPKKASSQKDSKKAVEKKKDKIIEDKTFGLKNKKGTKQQKFIQQVESQVKYGNQSNRAKLLENEKKDKKKDEERRQLEEINKLFVPTAQKLGKDVDPKSVLCAFFKQGSCGKGVKCKFSHDLAIERRAEKKSLYNDVRETEDNMEEWDDDKLKEVVAKKHGGASVGKTSIVCKHFLDAVESCKYGWFWECPNGGETCKYKHCLPPGFVLQKERKKMEEQRTNVASLEELMEKERQALAQRRDLIPVTWETFNKWKKRKLEDKRAGSVTESGRKKEEFSRGKTAGITGRQMFTFNPDMAADDDDEVQEGVIEREVEEGEVEKGVELTLEGLSAAVMDTVRCNGEATEARVDLEHLKLSEAAAVDTEVVDNNRIVCNGDSVPIDEGLFVSEDVEFDSDDLDSDVD